MNASFRFQNASFRSQKNRPRGLYQWYWRDGHSVAEERNPLSLALRSKVPAALKYRSICPRTWVVSNEGEGGGVSYHNNNNKKTSGLMLHYINSILRVHVHIRLCILLTHVIVVWRENRPVLLLKHHFYSD